VYNDGCMEGATMIGGMDPPDIGTRLGLAKGDALGVDGFIEIPVLGVRLGANDAGDLDGIASDDESGADDRF
jgi:hypothetical protein